MSVRKSRVSSLLAGTALGLALAFPVQNVSAQTAEAPIPAIGDLPPLTDRDIQPQFGIAAAPTPAKPAPTAAPPVPAAPPAQAAAPAPAETKAVVDATVPPSPDTLIAGKLRELTGNRLERVV